MAGARRAQLELQKDPGADIKVLVVWFDMVEGDERALWRPSLLRDERATHYWDAGKTVGSYYARRAKRFRKNGDVLWDAWLLYGPTARAGKDLAAPSDWGRTIVATEKRLSAALSRTFAAARR